MKSMTGFAFIEQVADFFSISIEIKSYNARFLDVSVILPQCAVRCEMQIRELVCASVARGKVEVSIRLTEKSADFSVTADVDVAKKYMTAMHAILDALKVNTLSEENSVSIPFELIIAQEGVLKKEHMQARCSTENFFEIVTPLLQKVLTEFNESRLKEGIHLRQDIVRMIERIENDVRSINEFSETMEMQFKRTLQKRFTELIGSSYDEQRILQEVAVLLVKYTINEELIRLASHLSSLKNEIENNEAPGKKIDFICQEINREINTIGSKNQMIEIAQLVIDAKDALENIREQARNIE